MNPRFCFSIVTLALLVAAVGCSKSSKLNTPSTLSPPSGPVELKIKWTPGERVVQEFDMQQDATINLPKSPQPMDQQMHFGQKYLLKVLGANSEGGHDLEMEFQAVHLSMKTGDKENINFDSENGSAAASTNAAAKVLGRLVGAKITYVMDASNNVAEVNGLGELRKRLQTGNSAAAALGRAFNENYFKQIMQSSRLLPPNPVQPGDTWPVKFDESSTMAGTISLNFTNTFKGWEMHGARNCARIEFSGTIESGPGGGIGPMGMAMTIQNGQSTGVYWFDPEFGLPIDSNMSDDMTMTIDIPKRAQAQVGAATITSQVSQVINSKVDSLE